MRVNIIFQFSVIFLAGESTYSSLVKLKECIKSVTNLKKNQQAYNTKSKNGKTKATKRTIVKNRLVEIELTQLSPSLIKA